MNKSQKQEILPTFSHPQILLLALLGLFTDGKTDLPAYPYNNFN